MPEGIAHKACKRQLTKILRGKAKETLIKAKLRADRSGTWKGRIAAYGEVDCKRLRGKWRCWFTIYDRRTDRAIFSDLCRKTRAPR